MPGYGNGGWSLPSFSSFPSLPNFPNVEHKDKITDLESQVTDLKDLVNQHRDTFNSKNSLDAGIQDESTSISIVVKVDL